MLNKQSSIHLLISIIFNQSCKSETAFKAPAALLKRLNKESYNLQEIEAQGYDFLHQAISAKPSLHRFPSTMAKYLYQSVLSLNANYESDPRNIWRNRTDAEIVKELTKLSGVGYHKAVQCLIYLDVLGEVDVVSSGYFGYMEEKCAGFFENIGRDLGMLTLFQQRESNMITGINHITISVKNIDTAFTFYKDILKLKPVMKSNHNAYFYAGDIWIALNQEETHTPSDNYAHIAFNIPESRYTQFAETIKKNNVTEWQKNQSEGDSLYILDDSGNKLEIHFSTLEQRAEYGKAHYDKEVQWF